MWLRDSLRIVFRRLMAILKFVMDYPVLMFLTLYMIGIVMAGFELSVGKAVLGEILVIVGVLCVLIIEGAISRFWKNNSRDAVGYRLCKGRGWLMGWLSSVKHSYRVVVIMGRCVKQYVKVLLWKGEIKTLVRRMVVIVAVCVISVGVLILRINAIVDYEIEQIMLVEEMSEQGSSDLIGLIVETPQLSHSTQKIVIAVRDRQSGSVASPILLTGKIEKFPHVEIGDICEIEGSVSLPMQFEDFDYAGYLRVNEIFGVIRVYSISCRGGTFDEVNGFSKGFVDSLMIMLRRELNSVKNSLVAKLDMQLPEPQSSLLAGILFGDNRVFEDKFVEAQRRSGTAHIVAASGYNVSIVVMAVGSMMGFASKKNRLVVTLVAIWIYCLIAGISPSILRATMMTSVMLVGLLVGVRVNVHIIMPMSVGILLLIQPMLIFEIGFLLSIFATLGLVYLAPMGERVISGKW